MSGKLIDIGPGKGLDTGLFPSAEDTVGGWATGRNAWFRELDIRHVPGQSKIVSTLARQSKAMAQAYVQGTKRLYYEDGGVISYVIPGGSPSVIGTLTNESEDYWLEPWGDWLIISDNTTQLKLWKVTGSFVDIAVGQFVRAKIIKKLAQHVIAYNTDVYPNGMHWCSASDVETWNPLATNSARSLPIRNLDSDIVAVADLAGGHAIYSRSYMLPLQYLGAPDWFGTPANALAGIGAVSKYSVVNLGKYNWGLCRTGIFLTDGNSFMYVDRPAVDSWIQDYIDWDRESEVVGYFDDRLFQIVWSVPTVDGSKSCIAVDPKDRILLTDKSKRPFTFLTGNYGSALSREVLDYPVVARPEGVYYASVPNTTAGDFYLQGGLYHAGEPNKLKNWDYMLFTGTYADAEVRMGFTDTDKLADVEWDDWSDMTNKFFRPGGPRESVYVAFEIRSATTLALSSIEIYGKGAGATA